MNRYESNKNPTTTKRGPGRVHVPGHSRVSGRVGFFGVPANLTGLAAPIERPPRVVGMHTGLTARQLQPQRLDGETFIDYRARRASAQRAARGA